MTTKQIMALIMCVVLKAVSAQDAPKTTPDMPKIEKSVPITSEKKAKKSDEPPACPAQFDNSLDTDGIASKVGRGTDITPPKPTHTVPANFSDKARRMQKDKKVPQDGFKSVVSLVVSKEGLPTQLCLKTPAGFGLDAEAGKAVSQYRFEPALKDKQPVAARINVEVSFRFY